MHPAGSEVLSLLVRGLSGRLVQPPARLTSVECGPGALRPLSGDPLPGRQEERQEDAREEAKGTGNRPSPGRRPPLNGAAPALAGARAVGIRLQSPPESLTGKSPGCIIPSNLTVLLSSKE